MAEVAMTTPFLISPIAKYVFGCSKCKKQKIGCIHIKIKKIDYGKHKLLLLCEDCWKESQGGVITEDERRNSQ